MRPTSTSSVRLPLVSLGLCVGYLSGLLTHFGAARRPQGVEEVLHLLTLLGSTRATGRFIYFETLIMKQATGRSDIE